MAEQRPEIGDSRRRAQEPVYSDVILSLRFGGESHQVALTELTELTPAAYLQRLRVEVEENIRSSESLRLVSPAEILDQIELAVKDRYGRLPDNWRSVSGRLLGSYVQAFRYMVDWMEKHGPYRSTPEGDVHLLLRFGPQEQVVLLSEITPMTPLAFYLKLREEAEFQEPKFPVEEEAIGAVAEGIIARFGKLPDNWVSLEKKLRGRYGYARNKALVEIFSQED